MRYKVQGDNIDQGSKSANFFSERSGAVERFSQKSVERSGAVERFCRKNLERSGAVEPKFQKISIFLVFFMIFSRIIAQKVPKRSQITPHALARYFGIFLKNKQCNTRYISKNLRVYRSIGYLGPEPYSLIIFAVFFSEHRFYHIPKSKIASKFS